MKDTVVGSTKSKTMWFSMAVMALGLVDQFSGFLPAIVPTEYNGVALAAVGLVTAVLRLLTKTPVADK